MDWAHGYSANYYLTLVDPASWRDLRMVDITAGKINKSTDTLMESADIDLTEGLGEAWVRVWVDAKQGDGGARSAIFTGLLQCPETKWDGIRGSYSAECYSVLKPASDVILQKGWYALAEQNGAQLAAGLLSVGPAPVSFDDSSPLLSESVIAEEGETNLSMAWKLVQAIGWRIRISGDGSIRICPQQTDTELLLDPNKNDIVEPDVTDTQDLYSCPNVFMAVAGDQSYIARDETGPLGIEARGREIWATESGTLNAGESIQDYAWRKLRELQSPSRTVKYSRRFLPDVVPGDAAEINFPAQKIAGIYTIQKQSISLGYNAQVSEEAVEIISNKIMTGPVEVYLVDESGNNLVTDNNELLVGEIA